MPFLPSLLSRALCILSKRADPFWLLSEIPAAHHFSDRLGEFVADMIVVVDKDTYDKKEDFEMTVEQAFAETVESGKVGLLSVDPKSLELRAPGFYRPWNFG